MPADSPLASLGPYLVRTVEEAAIASARTIGRGDRNHADQMAVSAMRRILDTVPAHGRVVIGEGERDKAPMLWSGEEFGTREEGVPGLDIAVDPLEGTNLCATGGPGAIAVLAASERGGLLTAPDLYMEKIMVGPECRDLLGSEVRLDYSPERNVRAIADAAGCPVAEATVVVLDRPRHEELIGGLRRAGARVRLIGDGDLSAGMLSAMPGFRGPRGDGIGRRPLRESLRPLPCGVLAAECSDGWSSGTTRSGCGCGRPESKTRAACSPPVTLRRAPV